MAPTISLCMIVKNEAAWLPRSLAAARGVVDEMVVLDTGSADGTPDVARSLGARVAFFPWTEHFAEARNRSLDLAKSDWILVLDADEIIRGGKLLRQLAGVGADAYRINIVNRQPAPSPAPAPVPILRFFRNDPALRYHGRIHERLEIAEYRVGLAPPTVCIHHYGYLPDEVTRKGKSRRNLDLLRLATAEENLPALRHFQLLTLGAEYQQLARWEEAAAVYARLLDDPAAQDEPFARATALLHLECLFHLGRFAQAAIAAEEIRRRFPGSPEALRWLGFLLAKQEKWAEAEGFYQAALRQPNPGQINQTVEPRIRAICWFELGKLYITTEKWHLASQCLAKALAESPPLPAAWPKLLEVLALLSPADRQAWLPGFARNNPHLPRLPFPEVAAEAPRRER